MDRGGGSGETGVMDGEHWRHESCRHPWIPAGSGNSTPCICARYMGHAGDCVCVCRARLAWPESPPLNVDTPGCDPVGAALGGMYGHVFAAGARLGSVCQCGEQEIVATMGHVRPTDTPLWQTA